MSQLSTLPRPADPDYEPSNAETVQSVTAPLD